jgi:hypothetical protein
MTKKENTGFVLFILAVLLLLFAVPVSQAISEMKKGNPVQALDLCKDLFATPLARAKTLHTQAARLSSWSDSLATEIAKAQDTSWERSRAQQLADDALVACGEMRKTFVTINRHVQKKAGDRAILKFDKLSEHLTGLMQSLRENGSAADLSSRLASVKNATDLLVKRFPGHGALGSAILLCKNLRYICWDNAYIRPYEKELENKSILATALRPVVMFGLYSLFQDLGDKGILGKSNWFYYKPDVDYVIAPYCRDRRSLLHDQNGKNLADDPVPAIKNFKKQLGDMGIDLIVVLMPAKPSIYPDMLNPGMSPALSGTISPTLRVIRQLRDEGVDAIDMFTPFAQERKNDSDAGDSIYLSKDTHWKGRAVLTAARVIAERVKQYPWYEPGTTEYAVDTVYLDRVGDVGTMTTLPAFKMHDLGMTFPTERTRCFQVKQVVRDAQGNETGRVLYKDEFKNSKILLMGDSYCRIFQSDEPRASGWIAHIARELSQPIASLVTDGGASTIVRQSLARRPGLLKGKKLVIWEVVERDLLYGAEGWKDVPILLVSN